MGNFIAKLVSCGKSKKEDITDETNDEGYITIIDKYDNDINKVNDTFFNDINLNDNSNDSIQRARDFNEKVGFDFFTIKNGRVIVTKKK